MTKPLKTQVARIAAATGQTVASLGLRFDKSVMRLTDDLQSWAETEVPSGVIVFVTVSAPILLRAKTAELLKQKILSLVKGRSYGRDRVFKVCGNSVRFRVRRIKSKHAPKLVVLVHNPEPGAESLLNIFEEHYYG